MSDILAPFYADDFATLFCGDNREVQLPDNFIDSIITDPPYGLSFMGKGWDRGVPGPEFWAEFLRSAKPGATLLAFGGTRTFHRMACAIEDAGWELRDCLMWLYGSGFPKSHDISKAMDARAGAEREIIGKYIHPGTGKEHGDFRTDNDRAALGSFAMCDDKRAITAASTDLAKLWHGYGTALKPAWEPIIVAFKPLAGTYAENAERYGVAGLNILGGRVLPAPGDYTHPGNTEEISDTSTVYGWAKSQGKFKQSPPAEGGRWPANVLHDGSDEVLAEFTKAGASKSNSGGRSTGRNFGQENDDPASKDRPRTGHDDSGSPARFFYCAKASKAEREAGLDHLPEVRRTDGRESEKHVPNLRTDFRKNHHPTVKPLALMRYLCELTRTPTGGIVFDPFSGSGSTLIAAKQAGRECVGIEMDAEYCEIIKARLRSTKAGNLTQRRPQDTEAQEKEAA